MEKEQRGERCQRFIKYVLDNLEKDKAMGAKLRRADNPAMEYQSWEYLVPFGVDLEYARERKAFATVAAALARAKPEKDGALGIGRAIASIYKDGINDSQAKSRLRRLLACTSSEEACGILRPLLRLVASRGMSLCYARLLQDLLYFSEKTRTRWASDFFNSTDPEAQKQE